MRSASEIREAGWTATLPSAETKWPVKSRSRAVLAKSLSDASIHPLPRVRRLGERADSVIDRRTFLAGTGAVLLAAPLAAEAEQAGKVWRVGFIYAGSKTDAARNLQPFLEGMRQLGYVEGRNLKVEVWAADRHPENIPTLAEQLVRANPDVIVVINAGHGSIVQEFTKTLPIVTLSAGELASSGLVASLVKPGGNLTGMQLYSTESMGKRLQILKETVPGVRRLAVLRTPIHWGTTLYRQATDGAVMKLGMRAHYVGFDDPVR